ncbi:MAG: 3-hydroxybutyryl-CoA dehydrogenase [Bacteroidetes bacterium SW_10_40_5]|nr:MAG: 3-hydroxybutyryl-CoA dehydrogenase [Bacteroidetes bacterium SW_10_40_5]
MNNIAVIGSGTMGNGIAHVFAQSGFKVQMIDIDQNALDKGIKSIEKNLDRQIKKEKITESEKENTLSNISTSTDLASASKSIDLAVEAVSEDINIKTKIFQQLDENAPAEAILASNTSSISITKLAAVTNRNDQVIGMHFMNPVPVMKLVEIIRGYATSDKVTKSITEISEKLGKVPVEAHDYPGFVANRILMPMINEAIYTKWQGIAGVQEIDTVMKLGMAHPMGPLQLADFIGLDVCHSILEVLHDGFGDGKYAPCPLLTNMVTAGKLGTKSGEGFYDYIEDAKNPKVSAQFT